MKNFNIIGRYGSWGAANMKKKELEANGNQKIYIFKDLTNSPFTAFRKDQYWVVGVGNNILRKEKDE